VTCSSSTGKGKGAPKKPKDPSKRHHLFKKRYQ
jgi:DNA excision repair protein ERCC-3